MFISKAIVRTIVSLKIFYSAFNSTLHHHGRVHRDGTLVVESAMLNGNINNLSHDTGCNMVAVKRSLIPDGPYTDRSVQVRTFCCANKIFPSTVEDLYSDYFTGRMEACPGKPGGGCHIGRCFWCL